MFLLKYGKNDVQKILRPLFFISLTVVFVSNLIGCGDVELKNQDTISPARATEMHKKIRTEGAENAERVLVKFKSTTGGASRSRSMSNAGLVQSGMFALVPGLTLAEPSPGFTVVEALDALNNDPLVAYAEPDILLTLDVIPDDNGYSNQYGLNNTGQTGGVINADISMESAWDLQTGNNVIVAIIDSGVDYNHVDLSANMWTNIAEIPGNRIDDDRNGYIDDVRGWNFNANNNNPMDDNDHGTHIAGIIGAKSNNGIGIAGINWNIKIMPLKFMNSRGQGRASAAISALEYAVNNGARISNNSWGGGSYSQALFDAIQAAHSANHLFVAAAGNSGQNIDRRPQYPSSYNSPNIISVGASDHTDRIAIFSNYGRQTVDLLAPGVSIYSTVRNNTYREMSGTSMAAPFVAGVAALLVAEQDTLSITNLKMTLLDNVDLTDAANDTVSGGRLNAFSSLSSIIVAPQPIDTTPVEVTPVIDAPVVDNPPVESPAPVTGQPVDTPAPTLNDVVIIPNVIEVAIGASSQLTASGGVPPYTWFVDKPNYASIDPDSGVFTGLTVGTVLVTAVDSVGTQSLQYPISLIGMQIIPDQLDKIRLTETKKFFANGGVGPYQWTVSDSSVVSSVVGGVEGSELTLLPQKVGSFSVTLTDSMQNEVSTSVIIIFVEPLILLPEQSTLQVDETQQLIASGGTSPYMWVSSNINIVDVDSGGVVTAKGAGSATITVQDFVDQTQSVIVTVGQPVNITSTTSLLGVSETLQLVASGGDGNYFWNSVDASLANVDNGGVITTFSPGFVTIELTDGQGEKANIVLEIRQINVTTPVNSLNVGDSGFSLNFAGTSGAVTWSISNAAIANVDSTGFFSPVAAGVVTVTATDGDGFSGSVEITVIAAAPTTTFGGGHH